MGATAVWLAGWIGGGEIVLVFTGILVVAGSIASRWPNLRRGLGHGLREFNEAARSTSDELNSSPDQNALVYEALTHENRSAEFIYRRK